jgi:Fur family transcriptional regulator, ferric uptake regulator
VTAAHALYGGARMSAQRALIAEAVLGMAGAFTAEDLHRHVSSAAPGIGLATVYRALAAMQASGAVAAVGDRQGSALLARCDRHDHHHHLVCTVCGSVVGIDCPLGDEAIAGAKRAGHLVTRHEITLYGLCAGCCAHANGGA